MFFNVVVFVLVVRFHLDSSYYPLLPTSTPIFDNLFTRCSFIHTFGDNFYGYSSLTTDVFGKKLLVIPVLLAYKKHHRKRGIFSYYPEWILIPRKNGSVNLGYTGLGWT